MFGSVLGTAWVATRLELFLGGSKRATFKAGCREKIVNSATKLYHTMRTFICAVAEIKAKLTNLSIW